MNIIQSTRNLFMQFCTILNDGFTYRDKLLTRLTRNVPRVYISIDISQGTSKILVNLTISLGRSKTILSDFLN